MTFQSIFGSFEPIFNSNLGGGGNIDITIFLNQFAVLRFLF